MTREELLQWAKTTYGTEPEYQWLKFPNYAVLRNQDGKWYAIVMDVPKRKFQIDSDEVVDVVNVKADSRMIDLLADQTGFYRAYHMNKNQWISIFLDGTVSEDMIKGLLTESYEKTSKKKRRI